MPVEIYPLPEIPEVSGGMSPPSVVDISAGEGASQLRKPGLSHPRNRAWDRESKRGHHPVASVIAYDTANPEPSAEEAQSLSRLG